METLIKLFSSIFGSRNSRNLKRYQKIVAIINKMEATLESLSDDELVNKSNHLRSQAAEKNLDDLLPEAFALVRESSKRKLGLRHFDVQIMGAIALHEGNISEMRTGEGKTLVATMPAYLNALAGNAVHIVTVNDYLASRDASWMGEVYQALGLTVSVIKAGMTLEEKRIAYQADIIYGTNNEFGFDYLRDNLAQRSQDQVQGNLNFAIIDEVDSILIDEARTPLIISGRSNTQVDLYQKINSISGKLKMYSPPEGKQDMDIQAGKVYVVGQEGSMNLESAVGLAQNNNQHLIETGKQKGLPLCTLVNAGDFTIDEKTKQAYLTEEGHLLAEEIFKSEGLIKENETLYDYQNIRLMHYLAASLRAHHLFKKEIDYIVSEGEVVIVDEFTGRTMPGRRWSDGLHQAIEAKEKVRIKEESQTVASITFQNYFRMYSKLSGMTGTADTEAFEFQQIYGLEVIVIPTHNPMVRKDQPDLMYLTQSGKFKAIIDDIKSCIDRKQPVLVGTTSIESSEFLSSILTKEGIRHNVLNAKQHEKEATIIAEAGRPSSVTIATNMAGRGTDIVLGGKVDDTEDADWKNIHNQVIDAGGLHIIGTERHESRRIDNQLRGRSGRQGDPGSSRFYLSLEDSLMRIFGDPDRTKRLLSGAGMREDEAIESKLLTKQIERAQRKVEAHNFDIRKQLLEFDDVANEQRKVIYQQREDILSFDNISEIVVGIREEVVSNIFDEYIPEDKIEADWDIPSLEQVINNEFNLSLSLDVYFSAQNKKLIEIKEEIIEEVELSYIRKCAELSKEFIESLERSIMIQQLDLHWREHIAALDALRQGIHLRGYAQKNPKQEYKRESFEMFTQMLESFKKSTITMLSKVQFRFNDAEQSILNKPSQAETLNSVKPEFSVIANQPKQQISRRSQQPKPETFVRDEEKVGRNQPCPCGSGKKFKHCHGKL
ncbi:MAG: preprotein translocase subunit SecA [Gammaproteobacteria bacterium]